MMNVGIFLIRHLIKKSFEAKSLSYSAVQLLLTYKVEETYTIHKTKKHTKMDEIQQETHKQWIQTVNNHTERGNQKNFKFDKQFNCYRYCGVLLSKF